MDQLLEAEQLFAGWDNWAYRPTPTLLVGLTCATWIQTAWKWRPQVAVIGPTHSGKTWLLQETMPPLFGDDICLGSTGSTEPGLRQKLANTSLVVILDEFEDSPDRKAIIKHLRGAGRGTQTLKGTSGSQKGRSFQMHLLP